MEGVRSAAEYGCNAWLTVRAADGALYEQLGHALPWQSLLRLGPRLTTLARTGGPRPDILWPGFERDIQETGGSSGRREERPGHFSHCPGRIASTNADD